MDIFHIVWVCVKQVWWAQWPAVIASPLNLACLKGLCHFAAPCGGLSTLLVQANVLPNKHIGTSKLRTPPKPRCQRFLVSLPVSNLQVSHCPKIAWTNYNHLYNLLAQNFSPPPLDVLVPQISQLFLPFFWSAWLFSWQFCRGCFRCLLKLAP